MSFRVSLRANRAALGLGVVGVAFLAGCASVPPSKQRLVAKANMVFSDSAVFTYGSRLLAQLEPGAAASGGAQATGCTSCR